MNAWKILIILMVYIISIGLAFFGGMEYKAHQVRQVVKEAFAPLAITDVAASSTSTPKIQNKTVNFGDTAELPNFSLQIRNTKTENTLVSKIGSPKTAKGKFVVIEAEVKSKLNQEWIFNPNEYMAVIDEENRQFQTYDDGLLSIENNLSYKSLAPGIQQVGNLVYEVPGDTKSVWLVAKESDSVRIILQLAPDASSQNKPTALPEKDVTQTPNK